MPRYALIGSARVQEIFDPDLPSLHPDVMAAIETVTAEVMEGWLKDPTHGFIPPPPEDGQVYTWSGSAWEVDATATDVVKDNEATSQLNTPQNRLLIDLFWDLEARLRALGSDSTIAEILAAADKPAYKAAAKGLLKDKI